MVSMLFRVALAASAFSLVSVTVAQPQQRNNPPQSNDNSQPSGEQDSQAASSGPSAYTPVGCFSSSEPLEDQGKHPFQSSGECQNTCALIDMPVMALVDGTNCFCGEMLPPKADRIGGDECNTPCDGYNLETCGGNGVYEVFLTGTTKNEIDHFDPEEEEKEEEEEDDESEEEESSSEDSAPSVVTQMITPTPVVDEAANEDAEESDGGGSGVSTAVIAAGSVAGVLSVVGLVGGVFFFLRYRKRREAEESYKNAVTASSFIENGKRPPPSAGSGSDSRLDPLAAHRRMSDGSIADNEDYSRRILQVTNPDNSHY